MVRNVIHLGLGQAATTVLTILLNAAVGRTLGPSDFGLLYLISSIATFCYVIVDWGHGPFIIRETARHPDTSGDLLGSALAARTIVALVVCCCAVASTWLIGYDVRTRFLTAALILALLPQYLGLSFGWVFRGYERMDRDALLNVICKLAMLIGSLACLALGGRLAGLIYVWSAAGLLTLGVGVLMYRNLNLPKIMATVATARRLLRDGGAVFVFLLAVAVEPYFNANVLYRMTSPTVVGWYGAAWNIAGTLIAPATILGSTMYPRFSLVAGDPVELKRTFNASFRPLLLLAVLGAVGTYLFADVPVGLIYGSRKFGPGADTLRAFSLVLLLMYVDIFLGMVILATGNSGRLARTKVGAVIFAAALLLVFVPLCQRRYGNGGLGVMYAMAIGELPMLITAGFLARAMIDRQTLSDVCRSLIAGGATIFLMRLVPASVPPYLTIPVCILAFMGLSLLSGALKRSDMEMLVASFRKSPPVPALTGDGPESPAA
jgi:O-antigen/teichoic acid export membrane protein